MIMSKEDYVRAVARLQQLAGIPVDKEELARKYPEGVELMLELEQLGIRYR
jgi:hypothetical protein